MSNSAELVGTLLGFGIGILVAGIMMSVYSTSLFYCGRDYICAGDQVSCNISSDSSPLSAIVDINLKQPTGITTYIFNKQPKRSNVMSVYDPYHFTDTIAQQVFVPFTQSSVVSYRFNASFYINVEFLGHFGNDTIEVVYSRNGVMFGEDSFVIDKEYRSAHFSITGDKKFDAVFYVNVTYPRYDVNSVKPVDKCSSYPCTWDLTADAFDDADVYVVTENNGAQGCQMSNQLEDRSMGLLVGGIIVAIIGCIITGLVVMGLFAFFCCPDD